MSLEPISEEDILRWQMELRTSRRAFGSLEQYVQAGNLTGGRCPICFKFYVFDALPYHMDAHRSREDQDFLKWRDE